MRVWWRVVGVVCREVGGAGAGARGRERLEARGELPVTKLEERVARLDRVSRADEDLGNDARQGRADGDVLGAGFDHADRGYRVAKIRGRRPRGRIGARPLGSGPGNRVRRPPGGEESDQRQIDALHERASVRGSRVTCAILPSSMWAMLCA